MKRFSFSFIVFFIILLAAVWRPIFAISFGTSKLLSYINEPLDAEVELINTDKVVPEFIKIQLLPLSEFERLGVEKSAELDNLKFEVLKVSATKNIVRIYSQDIITLPVLDFLISLTWPEGEISKRLTYLLDPRPPTDIKSDLTAIRKKYLLEEKNKTIKQEELQNFAIDRKKADIKLKEILKNKLKNEELKAQQDKAAKSLSNNRPDLSKVIENVKHSNHEEDFFEQPVSDNNTINNHDTTEGMQQNVSKVSNTTIKTTSTKNTKNSGNIITKFFQHKLALLILILAVVFLIIVYIFYKRKKFSIILRKFKPESKFKYNSESIPLAPDAVVTDNFEFQEIFENNAAEEFSETQHRDLDLEVEELSVSKDYQLSEESEKNLSAANISEKSYSENNENNENNLDYLDNPDRSSNLDNADSSGNLDTPDNLDNQNNLDGQNDLANDGLDDLENPNNPTNPSNIDTIEEISFEEVSQPAKDKQSLSDLDKQEIKHRLSLARGYINIGEFYSAEEILQRIIKSGDAESASQAEELLMQIDSSSA